VTGDQASLVEGATEAFERVVGTPPKWAWFVPGRIEVFGKHTDYAGGRSLVTAVSQGFAFVAAPRSDDTIRVIDARTGQTVDCPPVADDRLTGWRNYVEVVARRLTGNFPGALLGTDIAFLSNLPRSAGLSSSSVLIVGLATALVRRGDLDDRPEWREAIRSPLDLAGYFGAVENGLGFATLGHTSGVGTHGGSEDHTAILTCQPDTVSAYAYVPVRHLADARMPDDWTFVVMTSGIRASKAGAARDRYNRASLSTKALFDLWVENRGPTAPTLGALLSGDGNRAGDLRELAAAGYGGFAGDYLAKRLDHFVGEDSRVLEAVSAFAAADRRTLGDLSAASQHDADMLLGNQIDATRHLAALARREGAWAASSFGAGFGGSVWALVDAGEAPAFAKRWRTAYRAVSPSAGNVEWFVTRPTSRMIEISVPGPGRR
jgi:galactokinase